MNPSKTRRSTSAPLALSPDTAVANPGESAPHIEADVKVLDTLQVGLDDGYAFTKLVLPNGCLSIRYLVFG